MALEKLRIVDSGVELAYYDSGAPDQQTYTTVVALADSILHAAIFKKVGAVAPGKGIRFIALNRRNYPGSSPFTPEELDVVLKGTEEEKDAWMKDRGHEVGKFISQIIQEKNLPPISPDGKAGGIVLLGWSLGVGETNAAIAHADTLASSIRDRLKSYIRAYVLQECAPIILGLPMPEKNWAPFVVEGIPADKRLPFFVQWLTSYFDHGDLSKRDLDSLEYVVPSTSKPGSIYSMSKADQEEIICVGQETAIEGAYMVGFGTQFNANYRKALFNPATRALFPHMKITYLVGDKSGSYAIASLWVLEDDSEKAGKNSINFKVAPGCNHFVQWDDPEQAVDLYMSCA
ncbi:hypothetical protein GALMADRAFT_142438 [Galerina marginata CBS 339.88]|uniref:AB hydrolase-1 domain-containing protein n=1 Tax=Galerina marginata (strain CBS 339.88) TaxID=685588 RepID=A0A067SR03_GALM3|nr:hypothetical protein GALMADRAFT_142438 [Galerina marginata CBS 339.88]